MLGISFVFAVLGVLVPIGAAVWEFGFIRRKRLGYRVQMDTLPGAGIEWTTGPWEGLLEANPDDATDPSFMLIRFENIGATDISTDDYVAPPGQDVPGVTIRFPGRAIVATRITELSDPSLTSFFGDGTNRSAAYTTGFDTTTDGGVGILTLPKVHLNRHQHYKVLVVLRRADGNHQTSFADPEVIATVKAGVGQGRIKQTKAGVGTPRRVLALIAALVLFSAFQVVAQFVQTDTPLDCSKGSLTLTGSTALAPVVRDAADSYEDICQGARFEFDMEGSSDGLQELTRAGRKAKDSPRMLAFTDGQKSDDEPQLLPRPVAFSLFTIVANPDAGVADLSLAQVRAIYAGQVTNWSQIGGNDVPARLVSREPGSGTRKTFQQQVLAGTREGATNSDSCRDLDPGGAKGVIRCERSSTGDVLDTIATTEGALGYSELGAATENSDVVLVRIDGRKAELEGALHDAYPFWQVEYAYTYGEPEADSLEASFLRYLTNERGRDIIREHGLRPCIELDNPVLCTP